MRRALESVRRRSPDRYAEIAGSVERAPARYLVGDERFTVTAAAGRVSVRAGWSTRAPALIETSPHAVVALFDGTTTVEEMLADESLVVKAGADALLDLSSATSAFVREAAGAPVLSRQFEEYRSWVVARR